jgi:hypothetical protein
MSSKGPLEFYSKLIFRKVCMGTRNFISFCYTNILHCSFPFHHLKRFRVRLITRYFPQFSIFEKEAGSLIFLYYVKVFTTTEKRLMYFMVRSLQHNQGLERNLIFNDLIRLSLPNVCQAVV